MLSEVKTMKRFPPVTTINTIIKAMSSLKRIDDVMELWHELTEVRATGHPRARTLNNRIIRVFDTQYIVI